MKSVMVLNGGLEGRRAVCVLLAQILCMRPRQIRGMLIMNYKVEKSHDATADAECFVLASLMVHPAKICQRRCKVLCQARLADPCLGAGEGGHLIIVQLQH